MELTVLGSGGFLPQPDRPLPGLLLRHEGRAYLFDAGEGTQTRMAEYGLSSARLEAIFISHLHGDHLFGLPGVMVRRSQEGQRTDELDVFGPRKLRDFLNGLTESGSFDLLYDWNLNSLNDGDSFEVDGFEVSVVELEHRTRTFGFAFQHTSKKRKFYPGKAKQIGVPEGPLWSTLQDGDSVELDSGRTVRPEEVSDPPPDGPKFVYITDTRPQFDLPAAFEKPDLLVHEGMFLSEHKEHAWNKKHSTAREAARVAKDLRADRLLLTHFSLRYSDETVLLDEAKKTFPETQLARPGNQYQL